MRSYPFTSLASPYSDRAQEGTMTPVIPAEKSQVVAYSSSFPISCEIIIALLGKWMHLAITSLNSCMGEHQGKVKRKVFLKCPFESNSWFQSVRRLHEIGFTACSAEKHDDPTWKSNHQMRRELNS